MHVEDIVRAYERYLNFELRRQNLQDKETPEQAIERQNAHSDWYLKELQLKARMM
jgi:hypothetical protein